MITQKLNELDNGPGKVKNIPKINYGKSLRPEGTMAKVAKDNASKAEVTKQDKEKKPTARAKVESKLKNTLTSSDYATAFDGVPDIDSTDVIIRLAKKTGTSTDSVLKQLDKFAKQSGYKTFVDAYMDAANEFLSPQRESESLDEMAMDTITHKKFGKIGWHNESGVHKIKRNGKTVFSGSHKEAAKHWATIKHITECVLEESDKNKLRNLAHTNPEAADAAAALIRAYMDNPKKPISQVIPKIVEETGIAKAQLMKVLDELGIVFE